MKNRATTSATICRDAEAGLDAGELLVAVMV
jgi:hypothetical protein